MDRATASPNWVTGEALLWLNNDEHAYHVGHRIVRDSDEPEGALRGLLRDTLPSGGYGITEQWHDIDWDYVIDQIRIDIEEGYE